MKVSSDVFLDAPRWAGPACIFSTLEYLGRCAPRDIGSNADAVTPWNLARSEKIISIEISTCGLPSNDVNHASRPSPIFAPNYQHRIGNKPTVNSFVLTDDLLGLHT